MKKILMIVGSMREKSFNRRLAGEIESIIGERAEVSYLEYGDLPYMNQDIEFPAPESVARVRSAVQEADGLWICTPEYNFNIPGVLKNLLDWLSRPLDENDADRVSAVKGKSVTISGVAGKSAAYGVRRALSTLLGIMSMRVVAGEGTGVSLDPGAFMKGEMTISEGIKDALKKQANDLLSAID